MTTSTLTAKGQTTIPKEIREKLGLRSGDRIEYVQDAEGRVVLLPATRHVEQLCGILRDPARKRLVSLEEMDEAIRKGAATQR